MATLTLTGNNTAVQRVPASSYQATIEGVQSENPSPSDPIVVNWADIVGKPTFGTAASRDVPAAGNASTSQVVLGSDTRLTDVRSTTSALITDATNTGRDILTATGPSQVLAVLGASIVGQALFTAPDALSGRNTLGLGTIATQAANNVAITGGTMAGVTVTGGSVSALATDIAVADGGTGASTAAGARTNLGLGTISTVDSPVPIANGGTGETNVADVRKALVVPAQPTFRNRCINSQFQVAQLAYGTVVNTTGFVTDMWRVAITATATGVVATTGDPGHTNFIRITMTASTAPGTTGTWAVLHRIEGYDVADLAFGTSSAKTFTISFRARCSVAGTYAVALRNNAGSRSYVTSFTISAANVWEEQVVVVAGDQSGTWEALSLTGLDVLFTAGAGSNFTTTAGSWQAGNFFGVTGQTQLSNTNGATFDIQDVQLEEGTYATPLERRSLAVEQQICQRQLEVMEFVGQFYAPVASSTEIFTYTFMVQKRAGPTISVITSVTLANVTSLTRGAIGTLALRVDVTNSAVGNTTFDQLVAIDARL